MPTTNKRISLVRDTEEVTPVKAPPPGLILESKMLPLDQPIPSDAAVLESTATPPPLAASPGSPLSAANRATVRIPLKTLAGLRAPLPRPPLIPLPTQRAIVELVPIPQTSGPVLAPRLSSPPSRRRGEIEVDIDFDDARTRPPPSRTGLTLALAGLLIAGGLFAGWRLWWSVRPGHIEISTVPADAVIAVGGHPLGGQAPMTLEEPPGSYTISVTRDGYARSDRTVDLHAGQEVVMAIELASLTGGVGPAAVVDGVAQPPTAHATGGTPAGCFCPA